MAWWRAAAGASSRSTAAASKRRPAWRPSARLATIHARVVRAARRARAGRRRARGALLRRQRALGVRGRPGARGRDARRRPARHRLRRLHPPAGQGRGLRHGPRGQGPGRADGAGAARPDRRPSPDHAADALAVAICHANHAPLRWRSPDDRPGRGRGRGAPRRPRGRRDRVGVGYRLAVSGETLRHVPAVGGQVSLHAHLIVRDDALTLYGFATEEERDLFLLLIGVQSVGPKVALAVLGGGTPRELIRGAGRRRRRALPGGARHRQAHGGAHRLRAAREGRRRRPTWTTARSWCAAPTTRVRSRATACSSSASIPREADRLLRGRGRHGRGAARRGAAGGARR